MSIQFCGNSANCAYVEMFPGADESCLGTYLADQGYDLIDVLDEPSDGLFIALVQEATSDEWFSVDLPDDFPF